MTQAGSDLAWFFVGWEVGAEYLEEAGDMSLVWVEITSPRRETVSQEWHHSQHGPAS